MSKLLDAVQNAITSKPAKKEAVKKEVVPVGVLPEDLESAIKLDFKMSNALEKAEGVEYSAFKALVLKCNELHVFEDSKLLKLVQYRIAMTFKSETIAIRRNTMLNNTAKVAFGGTVGRESDGTKRTVKGKGWAAVLEVLTQATSIRTYHPLIAAAKPEAMKAAPKSEVEKAAALEKAKRNTEAKTAKNAGKAITHDQAFQVVLDALTMAEKFLLPGTHAKQLQQLHDLVSFFKSDLKHEEVSEEKAA